MPEFKPDTTRRTMNKQTAALIAAVLIPCIIMALVDAVLRPGYIIKSAVKIALFALVPLLYSKLFSVPKFSRFFKADKKGLLHALLMGAGVYALILGAYFALRGAVDFSNIAGTLDGDTGINGKNFIWVSLYISFANSLLEEFFFRGFAFLELRRVASEKLACAFSALMFALYHISIMLGWFGFGMTALTIAGLALAGGFFNLNDSKCNTIIASWLIHMFANFAINTVGFMLLAGR